VAELREEVTPMWAAAVMVNAQASWAKKTAQYSAVLLASAHKEVGKVARKVSLLKGELAIVCQA
jgi:hypothetical protein